MHSGEMHARKMKITWDDTFFFSRSYFRRRTLGQFCCSFILLKQLIFYVTRKTSFQFFNSDWMEDANYCRGCWTLHFISVALKYLEVFNIGICIYLMHFLLVLLLGKGVAEPFMVGWRKVAALKIASAFPCSTNMCIGSGKCNKILRTSYQLLIFLGAYYSANNGKNTSQIVQRCILLWMCFFHPWLNSREQQQHCGVNQHCPKVFLNLTSFCSCFSSYSSLLFSTQSLTVLPCFKDWFTCSLWSDVSNPSVSCGTAFVLWCTSV